MNYLAHTLLAPRSPQEQLGSLCADFVRGTLKGLSNHYPEAVVKGIAQHRKIDHFTDQHPNVLQSRQLFSQKRRRFSGIILDVLYDHFLHRHWSEYTTQAKQPFIAGIYLLLEQNVQILPKNLATIAPYMISDDWLGSYEDINVIGMVLDRISTRIKRENTLAGGIGEIMEHYEALEHHFCQFFPQVMEYAVALNGESLSSSE